MVETRESLFVDVKEMLPDAHITMDLDSMKEQYAREISNEAVQSDTIKNFLKA